MAMAEIASELGDHELLQACQHVSRRPRLA
jgi:hypothetical protein